MFCVEELSYEQCLSILPEVLSQRDPESTDERLYKYLSYLRLYTKELGSRKIDRLSVEEMIPTMLYGCRRTDMSQGNVQCLHKLLEELMKITYELSRELIFTEMGPLLEQGGF